MKGFTIIELMIALAIVGILLSIAIPACNEYVSIKKSTTTEDPVKKEESGPSKER